MRRTVAPLVGALAATLFLILPTCSASPDSEPTEGTEPVGREPTAGREHRGEERAGGQEHRDGVEHRAGGAHAGDAEPRTTEEPGKPKTAGKPATSAVPASRSTTPEKPGTASRPSAPGASGGGPSKSLTVAHVDAAGAAKLVKSEAGVAILDVRTPREFASGHLEGAINIDFRAADFNVKLGALERDRHYLVHCRSGGRSTHSLKTLEMLGFTRVTHLDGGMLAWKKAGLPVHTAAKKPE